MAKRLYRSRTDKMISGVCGGFANYFEIDPTLIRLGVAVLVLATGFFPGLVFYVICAIIIPEMPMSGGSVYEGPTVVVEPKMGPQRNESVVADDDDDDTIVVEAKMDEPVTGKVSLDK